MSNRGITASFLLAGAVLFGHAGLTSDAASQNLPKPETSKSQIVTTRPLPSDSDTGFSQYKIECNTGKVTETSVLVDMDVDVNSGYVTTKVDDSNSHPKIVSNPRPEFVKSYCRPLVP